MTLLARILEQDNRSDARLAKVLGTDEARVAELRAGARLDSGATRHVLRVLGHSFAWELNAMMRDKGLTNRELAAYLQTAPGTVSRWRAGASQPNELMQQHVLHRVARKDRS